VGITPSLTFDVICSIVTTYLPGVNPGKPSTKT
jgi:hypothetical protein